MKKNIVSIVLLIIVLVVIPVIIFLDYQNKYNPRDETFPDLPKDEKWEYIKDRLFDGETSYVQKLNGPILFTLENATKEDSLIVEKAIQKIKAIIPNKEIDFYERFIGKSPKELADYFKEKGSGVTYTYRSFFRSYEYTDIIRSRIHLGFNTDTSKVMARSLPDYEYYPAGKLSTVIRKQNISDYYSNLVGAANIHFLIKKEEKVDYIQELVMAHIVKSLCKIQNSRRFIKQVPSIYGFTIKKSFITIINENDKFLLQKLYEPDFIKQFNVYMYKTYPWRYTRNFLNKAKANDYANWAVIFLGILFFIIGFNLLYGKNYKYDYFNYLFPSVLLGLGFVNLNYFHVYLTRLSHAFSFSSFFIEYLFTMLFALIISLLLMFFDKYVINSRMNFTVQLIFKIIFTATAFTSPFIFLFITGDKIHDWSFLNIWGFPVLIIAIGRGLYIYLNHFSDSLIKQKDVELSRLKEINAQAEVKALQSQINPHFLYNALNSIASLAHKNADKTEQMALSLSDLFKYSINRKGKKNSTVKEEIEMVQHYLEIEQIRFGDRLKFNINVDKEVEPIKIPMFIIQPLVENAVKHGISKIENNGEITLTISSNNQGLEIVVADNGPHFPKGLVSGHGLQTVFDLLNISYGKKASLHWDNTPKKYISITIDKSVLE